MTAPQNRDETGRFTPGRSGNPGGRPKLPDELKTLIACEGPAAFTRLVELSKSHTPQIALRACEIIVAYHLGKPPQSVKLTGEAQEPPIAVVIRGSQRRGAE